jgi:hypothetical protein
VATADSFAGVGFAGVGSAPSPNATLNETKPKSSKRKADIRGNLAKMNAYLAEAAGYATCGWLPLYESDQPAAVFIRGRRQGVLSLSAISVVAR